MHGTQRRTTGGRRRLSPVTTGFACAGALIAVVAGGLGLAVVRAQANEPSMLLRTEVTATTAVARSTTTVPITAPTTTEAPTTTVAAAPTTTTPVNLPIPAPLPEDPYAPTPIVPLGTLSIPKLGVEQQLVQGMTLTAINEGPSHWPGTALPGQLGNMVIAGHRTTYTRPFRDLDQLAAGDQMIIRMVDGATHTYAVTGIEVVTPDRTDIASQNWAYTATLFACHPPGSAAYRIVAHLQLVDAAGRPVAPPPPPPPPTTGAATTGAAAPTGATTPGTAPTATASGVSGGTTRTTIPALGES